MKSTIALTMCLFSLVACKNVCKTAIKASNEIHDLNETVVSKLFTESDVQENQEALEDGASRLRKLAEKVRVAANKNLATTIYHECLEYKTQLVIAPVPGPAGARLQRHCEKYRVTRIPKAGYAEVMPEVKKMKNASETITALLNATGSEFHVLLTAIKPMFEAYDAELNQTVNKVCQ